MTTCSVLCLLAWYGQALPILGYAYPKNHGTLIRPAGQSREVRAIEPLREGYQLRLGKVDAANVELENGELRFQLKGPATFAFSDHNVSMIEGTGSVRILTSVKLPQTAASLKDRTARARTQRKSILAAGTRMRLANKEMFLGPQGQLLDPHGIALWKNGPTANSIRLSISDPTSGETWTEVFSKTLEFSENGSYDLDLSILARDHMYMIQLEFIGSDHQVRDRCVRGFYIGSERDVAQIQAERKEFDRIEEPFERELSWVQRCLSYECYSEALKSLDRAGHLSPGSKDVLQPIREYVERLAFGSSE